MSADDDQLQAMAAKVNGQSLEEKLKAAEAAAAGYMEMVLDFSERVFDASVKRTKAERKLAAVCDALTALLKVPGVCPGPRGYETVSAKARASLDPDAGKRFVERERLEGALLELEELLKDHSQAVSDMFLARSERDEAEKRAHSIEASATAMRQALETVYVPVAALTLFGPTPGLTPECRAALDAAEPLILSALGTDAGKDFGAKVYNEAIEAAAKLADADESVVPGLAADIRALRKSS